MSKVFIAGFINTSSSSRFLNVDTYTSPVVFNGDVYGTIENPFKVIENVQGYTSLSRLSYAQSSSVYVNFGGGNNTSDYRNAYYMCMIDESDFEAVSNFSGISNVYPLIRIVPNNISGKWRLNSVLSSIELNLTSNRNFSNYTYGFPVNVSINNVNYTGVKIEGVRKGVNTISLNDILFFNPSTNAYENVTLEKANLNFGIIAQPIPPDIYTWLNANGEEVFSSSYTIKDYAGMNVLASVTDAPPIVRVELSTVGDQKRLTLTGANGRLYVLTWSTPIISGKEFLGISNSPNSNRPVVPNNQSIDVSWIGDLIFYESYGSYRPPATTFDINLYQNSAEVNRVDKGQFLVGAGTLSGALREECSMLTPSIVYQSSHVPTFNYVYIPIFNRYYYVTSLSSVGKNVWRMELNCDVLMTYKEKIFLLQGVIGRQEIDFNPLLVDNELPTQNDPIVEVIDIPSDAFSTQSGTGHNFLLTVIGA